MSAPSLSCRPGLASLASLAFVISLSASLLAPPAAAAKPPRARAQPATTEAGTPYRGRPELSAFAAEVAARRGWDQAWVMLQLADARQLPRVAQLIMPPPAGTAKNWAAYRERFIEPRRVAAGLDFWQANEDSLQRAESEYGVPPEVVVGIVGVETFYGRVMGNFRVLDALATLAFDFPSGRSDRSALFRAELEELLVLARREGQRAGEIKGSYAGAIGWPQFLPGSINRHAVDFDGDGHIDLQRSLPDVIGSVAHYLQAHGWQRGMATHYAVQPPPEGPGRALLLAPDIKPSFSAAQMAEQGAALEAAATTHAGPLALVELHNGDAAPSHVAGTENFYAITRYNWSSYYALAVITLGETVKALRQARSASNNP
ncbi:MAG: lytic murein transglycosylase B [Proteobacteria bacterium]|nr:lytic murein transglycosylase B [Pseudomonadota bacterium]